MCVLKASFAQLSSSFLWRTCGEFALVELGRSTFQLPRLRRPRSCRVTPAPRLKPVTTIRVKGRDQAEHDTTLRYAALIHQLPDQRDIMSKSPDFSHQGGRVVGLLRHNGSVDLSNGKVAQGRAGGKKSAMPRDSLATWPGFHAFLIIVHIGGRSAAILKHFTV